MTAQSVYQRFGLGTLVGSEGTNAPRTTVIEVVGRGLFVRVKLTFGFDGLSEDSPRVFLMERPWNSVLAGVSINGESAKPAFGKPTPQPVQATFYSELENQGKGRPGVACHIPAGLVLKELELEYCLALDILSHQGVLAFASPAGMRNVDFRGSWDLAGLPGATLAPLAGAGSVRMDSTESRHSWKNGLVVSADEAALWALTLDEKKAASLSFFAPSKGGTGKGCAAVAVVAPVRPQLVRDAVKLAIYAEIRNPQEGLAVRGLVEKAASVLKSDDSLKISVLGVSGVREIFGWTSCEDLDDDALAPLLEPAAIGKAGNLTAALKELTPTLDDATHVVLATPGVGKGGGSEAALPLPTFILATGRKPHRSVLESLSEPTGGFVSEFHDGGLELFLDRMRTRMSPPLLRDFRLDGWGLDEVYPPGLTQVYTDQPTFVFGLYDGLLPKTVTLTGFSPAGQKLAQRVKVVPVEDFDLMPLYVETARRWKGQAGRTAVWGASEFTCFAFAHPSGLKKCLEASETVAPSSEGPELMSAPKLGPVHTAVTMEEETFEAGEPAEATMFAPPIDPIVRRKEEAELQAEEPAVAPALSVSGESSPVRILRAPADQGEDEDHEAGDEEEEAPAEIGQSGDFDIPTGPPQIFGSGAAVEPEAPIKKSRKKPNFGQKPARLSGVPGAEPEPALSGVPGGAPELESTPAPAVVMGEGLPEPEPEPEVEDIAATEPLTPLAAIQILSGSGPSPSASETLVDAPVVAPAPAPQPAEAPAPAPPEPAPPAPVTPRRPPGEMTRWLERLGTMDDATAATWLSQRSIDQLGLALAGVNAAKAEKVLVQLSSSRRQAVEVQLKWGQLLDPEELSQASQQLLDAL